MCIHLVNIRILTAAGCLQVLVWSGPDPFFTAHLNRLLVAKAITIQARAARRMIIFGTVNHHLVTQTH